MNHPRISVIMQTNPAACAVCGMPIPLLLQCVQPDGSRQQADLSGKAGNPRRGEEDLYA